MTLPPSPARSAVPVRLRARIALLVTTAAMGGFIAMAGAGWLLVLEAEDAIMEAIVVEAIAAQRQSEPPAPPAWLGRFADDAALLAATGLERPPSGPGPHEMFATPGKDDAVVINGILDRWRVWLGPGREQEYRLLRDVTSGGWLIADLSHFEFTEGRIASVRTSVIAVGVAVGIGALLVSALIARWTLHPIVALAARVHASAEPAGHAERPLAEGLPDDEVGFLARALDDSRHRVAESLARERMFISECSHELRTPLAVLKAAAALLPEVDPEPAQRARVLARIDRAVHRSERLVQFFLVLAREGRERADTGWVPLRTVVQEAVDDQRTILPGPARTITILVPETVSIHSSRDVLLMLVHNLLGNALQHAGRGSVCLSWTEDLRLAIDDEGPGFPTADEKPRPRGYGIGLALAQRLCETQGWRLHRERSTQGGARVAIQFSTTGVLCRSSAA